MLTSSGADDEADSGSGIGMLAASVCSSVGVVAADAYPLSIADVGSVGDGLGFLERFGLAGDSLGFLERIRSAFSCSFSISSAHISHIIGSCKTCINIKSLD